MPYDKPAVKKKSVKKETTTPPVKKTSARSKHRGRKGY